MRALPMLLSAISFLCALGTTACAPQPTEIFATVLSLSVTPEGDTLRVGDSVQLTATLETSGKGSKTTVRWSSSNVAAATVSSSGLVHGKAVGDAWIHAKSGSQRDSTQIIVVATASVAPPSSETLSGYHVSPAGSAGGDGSAAHPWDLATALAGADGRVQPGDTVWLHGGTYRGSFRTALAGTADAYIVFRQARGERATIDGTLRADGAHLAFWGFEIMQSDPVAVNWYGLQANTNAGRFINLVIHDAGTMGVSFWTPGEGAELYGNIVYNNGTHENLDHGVYVHNYDGTKRITDNVFFNNFARGIQIYAGSSYPRIVNVHTEGNISFNNGTISGKPEVGSNLLINAQTTTAGMVARGNLLYFSRPEGLNIRLGRYSVDYNKDVELEDNYVVGGRVVLEMELPWDRAVVRNNTLIGYSTSDMVRTGGTDLPTRYTWDGNRHFQDPAALLWRHGGAAYNFSGWRQQTGLGAGDEVVTATPPNRVMVRPNRYEPGRAHIAVVNWEGLGSVAVDLSGVLAPGARYEIRNVQDVFGAPVSSGTYEGGVISIPMSGVAPPQPIAHPTATPPRTGPHFDTFLLTSTPQ